MSTGFEHLSPMIKERIWNWENINSVESESNISSVLHGFIIGVLC